MKLRYLFTALVAGLGLMTACTEEFQPRTWDEIQVSSSYVTIDQEGGSTVISLTAADSWTITNTHEWLTVSPMSGNAGSDIQITFSADADVNSNSGNVTIECAGKTQIIAVQQGLPQITVATCAEVINGVEGKLYQVTGICTAIANTNYGNWYLNDGTGELYIYGTVNSSGNYAWSSFNIEVGDEVTVQGNRTTYGSTIEFVDALFISVNKSLIAVESTDPEDATLPIEGGELVVNLMCKGEGLSVEIPEEAKSWLSVVSVDIDSAEETAAVTLLAAENPLGDRDVILTFVTTDGSKDYTAELTIAQKGAIIDATAAEINAAEDGATIYRITGMISSIANTKYGNLYIRDYTGDVYVYGTNDFSSLGLAEGDIITVTGPKASYNGNPQMKDVTVEAHYPVSAVSVADFLATEQDDSWYSLTGTVTNLETSAYGNFDIVDETGSVYVYGVLQGWGGPKKQWESLGVVEGDTITIIGKHSSYNGTDQVGSAFYVSHEPAASGEDPVGNTETVVMAEVYADATGEAFNFEDGVEYAWGSLTMTSNTQNDTPNRYWVSGGDVRIYTDSSITISAGDRTMTSIEFTTSRGTFTVNVGEYADSKWTGSASSVTFTATEQVRLSSMTVTFAE